MPSDIAAPKSFDAQTFQWIKEHALAADALQPVDVPDDPSYIQRFYDRTKGTVTEITARPAPRDYIASSLTALAGLVSRHYGTRAMTPPAGVPPTGVPVTATTGGDAGERCTVFVGEDSVVAVLDETGDRRERFTWPLRKSEAWTALQQANKKPMSQKDFLTFLRLTVRKKTYPANLTEIIRQLKFVANSSGSQNIQAGKESMGRSVEMSVAGIDAALMPDEITVNVPIYDDLVVPTGANAGQPMLFPIVAALDVDMAQQTFTLRVMDGEMPNKLITARTTIMGNLAEPLQALIGSGAVFLTVGTPNI